MGTTWEPLMDTGTRTLRVVMEPRPCVAIRIKQSGTLHVPHYRG